MNKVYSVLKALLTGLVIQVRGLSYRMDIDYRLCQIAHNQHGEEVLLIVNLGDGVALSWFIQWCEAMPEDDYIHIASNLALNEILGDKHDH